MAVFRLERTRDYTVMSNHHLRDKRLSLKAKGLLSQMLSLPEDWDYTLSGLAYINRESKDAIRSAINELERAGYVQRHQDFFHGLLRVAQELSHIVPDHGTVFWRQVKQRLFDLTDSWHDATPLASPAAR